MGLKEELMNYLSDNYLPMPDQIEIDYSFCIWREGDTKILDIGFEDTDLYDKWFMEFLCDLGLRKDINFHNKTFALPFLHELGHIATLDNFSEQEKKESKVLQNCIEIAMGNKLHDGDNTDVVKYGAQAYWNLPVERAANEWLINMVNLFPSIVKDIVEIFDKNIDDLVEAENDYYSY